MQNSCHEHISLLKYAHQELPKRIAVLQNENARLKEAKTAMEEFMSTKVQRLINKYENLQEQCILQQTLIDDNADTTFKLHGRIHDLNTERDKLTDKLNNSELEVKLLHSRVRWYRFVAIVAFLTALVVGIILQHCFPTLFDVTVQLLLPVFLFGWPMLLFYLVSQDN